MKRKVEKTILKSYTTSLLFLIIFTSVNYIINTAYADDITDYSHNSTFLSVTTPIPEPPPPPPPPPPTPPPPPPPSYFIQPIINWYDFQSSIGISKLNSKIDVNQEYKFCINITSDQGWDDIEYIDIKAWFDQGNEGSFYNQTKGGNINLFLRYENTTGNASFTMLWPDDEVKIGTYSERKVTLAYRNTNDSETCILTFSFIPGFQFRYAPGDGSWNKEKNAINDIWSWNFEISVTDSGEFAQTSETSSIVDEFGVNPYSEMISVGFPSLQGRPGENATDSSSLSIKTRSNLDYSLSVDVDSLKHWTHPTAKMSNQTIWVRGGDMDIFSNFGANESIYFYGSPLSFKEPDDDDIMRIANNLDYKCKIPFAQIPGNYYTIVRYTMETKH